MTRSPRPAIRRAFRAVIIVFCIAHMFFVAAYVIPHETQNKGWNRVAGTFFNMARPYILSLSQWQKWDIFSPDPLRRASTFAVEALRNGQWHTVRQIDFAHLPWYERAKELKILGRLEEDWNDLSVTFLQQECASLPNAAGTQVRLQAKSWVIPRELASLKHVADRRAENTQRTLGVYQCTLGRS